MKGCSLRRTNTHSPITCMWKHDMCLCCLFACLWGGCMGCILCAWSFADLPLIWPSLATSERLCVFIWETGGKRARDRRLKQSSVTKQHQCELQRLTRGTLLSLSPTLWGPRLSFPPSFSLLLTQDDISSGVRIGQDVFRQIIYTMWGPCSNRGSSRLSCSTHTQKSCDSLNSGLRPTHYTHYINISVIYYLMRLH